MKRAPLLIALSGVLVGLGLLSLVIWLQMRPAPLVPDVPRDITPAFIERGAQLARAGNCMACHTERGGAHKSGSTKGR